MSKKGLRAVAEVDSPRRSTGSDAVKRKDEGALEPHTISEILRENPALCVACGKELRRLVVEDLILEDPIGDERLIPAYCYECANKRE